MDNPFILEPYRSKELFCDREDETARLLDCMTNGRNVTLISPRRLGKTGLIYRAFEEIKDRDLPYETFYMDISSSQSIDDFVKLLAEAVAGVLNRQNRIKELFKALKGIRPLLGYDPVNDSPTLSFTFQTTTQKEQTIKSIFSYLDSYKRPVVLAIDEFQQVREYPDVYMEALLRTYIQPLRNVHFIFCGSKKHIMAGMFTNALKPFYESTTNIPVAKLDAGVYSAFIETLFRGAGKMIPRECIEEIITWTRNHTFYTQSLCNEVFHLSGTVVTGEDLRRAKEIILTSNRDRFLEIQRLITPAQWKLLRAIAKDEVVQHPTSSDFIRRHRLSSGPAVLKNMRTLVDKELVLTDISEEGVSYSIYNVFLSRYLELL
ncbi:MAG: ATP-binding protein [Bacteroidales bacterium]|nr:ATP-binding protein [Bacteroidales bacterium]